MHYSTGFRIQIHPRASPLEASTIGTYKPILMCVSSFADTQVSDHCLGPCATPSLFKTTRDPSFLVRCSPMSGLYTTQRLSFVHNYSWTSPSATGRRHTDDALSGDTTLSLATMQVSSTHLYPCSRVSGAWSRSVRGPEVCVNRLDPFVCQVHDSIYWKRVFAGLERYIAKLVMQTPPQGAGLTTYYAFQNLPIFRQISREELCEQCALRQLGNNMCAPRGLYNRIRTNEKLGRLWLEDASRVPPPSDMTSVGSPPIADAPNNHQPQRLHLVDNCISRIDWADPCFTRTVSTQLNLISAENLEEPAETIDDASNQRQQKSRRKLRGCFASWGW
jgi:hypothetical protein